MMGPIRFVSAVLWFAVGLSTLGVLKDCTRTMAGMAVYSSRDEVMSLGKWNRKLHTARD